MLSRLMKQFYWKNFEGYKDKVDKDGYLTGTEIIYSKTLSARANVSANKGSADSEVFGNLLEYDRVIITRDTELDLSENSIVWLDGAKPPDPHNYIVVRKALSNNYLLFALKRVETSNETTG